MIHYQPNNCSSQSINSFARGIRPCLARSLYRTKGVYSAIHHWGDFVSKFKSHSIEISLGRRLFFLFPKCPSLTFVFLDSIGHLICRTCQVQFIPWILLYLKNVTDQRTEESLTLLMHGENTFNLEL